MYGPIRVTCMVVGYMCVTHGFVRECGVSESGERVCQQCGDAVTGVSGSHRDTRRSPPEDSSTASGTIDWTVDVRGLDTGRTLVVNEFDLQAAAMHAVSMVDNPQTIKEIRPTHRPYRAMPA